MRRVRKGHRRIQSAAPLGLNRDSVTGYPSQS